MKLDDTISLWILCFSMCLEKLWSVLWNKSESGLKMSYSEAKTL